MNAALSATSDSAAVAGRTHVADARRGWLDRAKRIIPIAARTAATTHT
jgi:hypothetical protein